MPPNSTLPDTSQLDFLDNNALASVDLIRVWDRSSGREKWTNLAELDIHFTFDDVSSSSSASASGSV